MATGRAPLTQAEWAYIGSQKQAGATLAGIAKELHCARATVRKWWRRTRQGDVPVPRGRPRRGVLSTYPPALIAQAVALKQAHPHWGPANVRLELQRHPEFQSLRLPSLARLSALFKARCPEAVQPRRPRAYAAPPPPPVRQAHQRWQMDGKEKVPVGDHDVATLLEVRDPATGVILAARAILTTTARGWRKVTLAEAQATLREAFSHWGLPLELQTDHEGVYTGSSHPDFPSAFTLWLRGLGLQHVTSRDRRPTDQPHIERNHRTLGDMSWRDEPSATVAQLQALLDARRQRHNEELPVQAADCQGRPPLVAYPHARHSGRPFACGGEWLAFDLARVDAYLAQFVWTRRVSASGSVAVGNHLYYAGRSCLHETLSVRFNPATRAFRFERADGTLLVERPAVGLDKLDLIGYMPVEEALPVPWQFPLLLEGV